MPLRVRPFATGALSCSFGSFPIIGRGSEHLIRVGGDGSGSGGHYTNSQKESIRGCRPQVELRRDLNAGLHYFYYSAPRRIYPIASIPSTVQSLCPKRPTKITTPSPSTQRTHLISLCSTGRSRRTIAFDISVRVTHV